MEPLQGSINEFRDNIAKILEHSTQLKKMYKFTEAEREMVMKKTAAKFCENFTQRVDVLLQDTEVGDKLDQLKDLIEESDAFNKDVGIECGYRPVAPNEDIMGHLKKVQDSYSVALDTILNGYEDKYQDSKEELREKTAQMDDLEREIRSYLKK